MDKEIKGYIKTTALEIQNFKVADKKERIIEGFFTTADVDRGGDVSLTSAFNKTIPQYMKNPILTYMHNLDKVMGKVLDYKVIEDRGIWIKAQVAKNVKWVDEDVWPLIEQGIIKGFSYGYSTVLEEKGTIDEKEVNFLKEVELFEIAVVTLPMNANALFNISSTGAVKSIKLEDKLFKTPENSSNFNDNLYNKKEEEIDVEKIDELLENVKTLTESIDNISKKFNSLDEKAKEVSEAIAVATASKIKEMQDTERKSKEDQEAKEKEEEAKNQEESEVLENMNEVNKTMSLIVKLLTPKEEEK